MTSQLDTFPDIPDDIIRLIFEAAVQAERSAALNLVLLARHVQKWIQPLQFKAVHLCHDQGAEDFLQEITSNPTRLGIHVQTMTVRISLRPGLSKAIVDSLPHLSTLSIFIRSSDIRPFFSSRVPSLRQMSVTVGYQSDPELTLHKDIIPFLPESMTHLELLHAYNAYALFPDQGLKHLTRLTHLIVQHNCYENGTISEFITELLLHLPDSMQQIVIAVTTDDPHFPAFRGTDDQCFAWVMEQCDPRVVFVMQPPKIKVHKSKESIVRMPLRNQINRTDLENHRNTYIYMAAKKMDVKTCDASNLGDTFDQSGTGLNFLLDETRIILRV
ncbi:hypothetical protein C8J56DRAFT_891108 [Mycena floridula]|nr:hypothetical protein C8J56DRAFT_891108 [Mycena floridula]